MSLQWGGGGQIILRKGPVAVVVVVFTGKPGRLRLDEKIMCQTQEFNQARRGSVTTGFFLLVFFPPREMSFLFFS